MKKSDESLKLCAYFVVHQIFNFVLCVPFLRFESCFKGFMSINLDLLFLFGLTKIHNKNLSKPLNLITNHELESQSL